MVTGVLSRRWRHESEVDLSTSSSVDMKNDWSYTATPSIRLHGAPRDSLTFLPFITLRTILRYSEGTRLRVFFTELLIHNTAIWSLALILCMMFQFLKRL
jgi:hypothetical protein